MKHVFPALEKRFKADKELVKVGRKLYEGFAGEKIKPPNYVEVTCTGEEGLDTFDDDINTYRLVFSVKTKDGRAATANDIAHHLRRVFSDANLRSEHFDTVEMQFVDRAGAALDDGTFGVEVTFDLTIQRKSLVPVARFT